MYYYTNILSVSLYPITACSICKTHIPPPTRKENVPNDKWGALVTTVKNRFISDIQTVNSEPNTVIETQSHYNYFYFRAQASISELR